jgi:hypothetical protein
MMHPIGFEPKLAPAAGRDLSKLTSFRSVTRFVVSELIVVANSTVNCLERFFFRPVPNKRSLPQSFFKLKRKSRRRWPR